MVVDVLQYFLPNGRTEEVTTELPDEFRDLYDSMRSAGCRFEAEILRTGEVSVTIHDIEAEEDLDIRVIPNGPEVQAAMIQMLQAGVWGWLERR